MAGYQLDSQHSQPTSWIQGIEGVLSVLGNLEDV